MGWYEKNVFNPVLEHALGKPAIREARRQLLVPARGCVLEVGMGAGMNLECYPNTIREVTALTLDPMLDPRALRRAHTKGIVLRAIAGDAAAIPLQAATFDTVVCTFVLCSLSEPERAVGEFARVLRPDGCLLFLEHGLALRPFERGLQHMLNPVNRVLSCGCSLVSEPRRMVETAFSIHGCEEGDLPAMLPLFRRVTRGHAVPR